MDQTFLDIGIKDRRIALLEAVSRALPSIAATAALRDETASFPASEWTILEATGATRAPLPAALGGLGLGTAPDAAQDLLSLLAMVGSASLPLGRIFEGHVNALRLITRLGTPEQLQEAARDARTGHMFGVWNTDPRQTPLTLRGGGLSGAKILASGAGFVTRPLVTAGDPPNLMLVRLEPDTGADLSAWTAQGMRASATGRIDFDHVPREDIAFIGPPGAYLAEPDFAGGAWRASAVALGGLDALLAELCGELVGRDRHQDPHQQARIGAALIAQETARLWLRRAASLAEAERRDAAQVVAYVGLARIAVETACLDAMRLAQRSIGLSAFMRPAPIERICRDLATYLRQPAPDATLTAAAAYFMQHPLPPV